MKLVGRKPKLTREQVADVQAWWRIAHAIPTAADLARLYGVSPQTIKQAARGAHKSYADRTISNAGAVQAGDARANCAVQVVDNRAECDLTIDRLCEWCSAIPAVPAVHADTSQANWSPRTYAQTRGRRHLRAPQHGRTRGACRRGRGYGPALEGGFQAARDRQAATRDNGSRPAGYPRLARLEAGPRGTGVARGLDLRAGARHVAALPANAGSGARSRTACFPWSGSAAGAAA